MQGMTEQFQLRNFGIVAHIDAGKTTLTERILYTTGTVRYCGEVQEGTTVSDYLEQERERGISIISAAVSCNWRDFRFNLIDTPGHVDFTAEVERALRVMDGVVVVCCGVHGVQAQTETVWRRARRHHLPALAFVNKLDRDGADFCRAVEELRAKLSVEALPVQLPLYRQEKLAGLLDLVTGETEAFLTGEILTLTEDEELQADDFRQQLLEALAETDDLVLQAYLQNQFPEPEVLRRALRSAVASCQILPVFAGSAGKALGVSQLLDGIGAYLPSPNSCRLAAEGQGGMSLENSSGCCALVFQAPRQDWQGSWLAARIYNGEIRPGKILLDVGRKCQFTVEKIWRLKASEIEEIAAGETGDIVGLSGAGLEQIKLGDTLCGDGLELLLDSMEFPPPVVSLAVEGCQLEDRRRLPEVLKAFAAEDPTLNVAFDELQGQWVLSGLGEFHLTVVLERLRTEAKLATRTGNLQVRYQATVAKAVQVESHFTKQLTPDICFRAGIRLELEPLPMGSGIQFDLGKIKGQAEEEILTAVRQGLQIGVDTAYHSDIPLTDTRVTVYELLEVAKKSSELAFLTVSQQAVGEALRMAGVIELEPVMRLLVSIPQDQVGSVSADLTARRGRIAELDSLAPGMTQVVAFVPLAEMFGYASELRSLTGGRAEFTAEPFRYESRT